MSSSIWDQYRRTLWRRMTTDRSENFLRNHPDFFTRVIRQAIADQEWELVDNVMLHLDDQVANYGENFDRLLTRNGQNIEMLRDQIDAVNDRFPGIAQGDSYMDVARDISTGVLNHINTHSRDPTGGYAEFLGPIGGQAALNVYEAGHVAKDIYDAHVSHGPRYRKRKFKAREHFRRNKKLKSDKGVSKNTRHPKYIFGTDKENLFDVSQPAALPQNKSNSGMFSGPRGNMQSIHYTTPKRSTPSSGRNSYLFPTPRSVRFTPRRKVGRLFGRRGRRIRLRRRKGKYRKGLRYRAGLRNPGIAKSRKRMRFKKSKKIFVGRKLAKKIKKVIRGGLPSGRHIQVEVNRYDPSFSNRIFWIKNGIKFNGVSNSFDPENGHCGEIMSPFEVLRKCNELWLDKTLDDVNYQCSATLNGDYASMGSFNNDTQLSRNLLVHKVGDSQIGSIPKLDVVKHYYRSEWTNQTQRCYYLEFYEIMSKRSGSHGVIGDPWTAFVKETETLVNTQGMMSGRTGRQYLTGTTVSVEGPLDYPSGEANQETKVASTNSSMYPFRPEMLPGWNKSWKYKKTKVKLEPGQTYVYNVKGWTGLFDYRKMFKSGMATTPNFSDGSTYMIHGVQKNMNKWILVGGYPDIVASATVPAGTPSTSTFVRAGRLDRVNPDGALGLIFETTQVLKVKYPESLLNSIPPYAINTGTGNNVGVADLGYVAQGGSAPYSSIMNGVQLADLKRPRLVIWNRSNDNAWPIASEEHVTRIDETNPNIAEGTTGGTLPFGVL